MLRQLTRVCGSGVDVVLEHIALRVGGGDVGRSRAGLDGRVVRGVCRSRGRARGL